MRLSSWLAAFAIVGMLTASACQPRSDEQAEARPVASAPDQLPPFDRPPLDPPLRVTATFGEYRRGHFHAGLDFSTDQAVGRPVYAPVAGYVERIRTSGAGFGRSLMLRSADGRTILFAHLDAFEEPIASFIAAVQESTGRYEQDVVVDPDKLPVRSGQRVALSGESGAGPPHLHMEVRWGDMAYNPLRFGLTIPDRTLPVLRRVTLEPLDDTSYVGGSAGPRTYVLGATTDTIVVSGRVRAWLESIDGVSEDWLRVAPYAASMEWDGATVECRFDRIPWDEEMPAVEWVYDGTGRVAPASALGLWVASGYRPSVISSSRAGPEAGVLAVRAGDPPRPLTLRVHDAAGNRAERRLVIRPPRAGEPRPSPPAARRRAAAARRFELLPVEGPFVRIRYGGAAPGARDVALGMAGTTTATRPATFDGRRWTAVVRVPPDASALLATGRGASATWEERVPLRLAAVAPERETTLTVERDAAAFRFSLPESAVFVPTFVVVDSLRAARGTPAMTAASPMLEISPAEMPIRRAARIEARIPGSASARTGLFYMRGSGWRAAGSAPDSAATADRKVSGQARSLGRFAVFDDVAPPRIGLVRAIRLSTPAPNRWSLQCRVIEHGSGLDTDRTYFEVDGRRVPSEWDAERGILRWRPHRAPPRGSHAYTAFAVDRAGHQTRRTGTFVAP